LRMIAGGGERERNAVHHRHANVSQQQVEGALGAHDQLERLGTVIGGDHVMAVERQRARDQRAQPGLVLGNHNARHINLTWSTSPAPRLAPYWHLTWRLTEARR